MNPPLHQIPTNIITGFLGVGKTTTITQLLQNKPADERWAVLVNEFGEIGVDGALLDGATTDQNSVFIREVPGGCLCCAASVPLQVALNQLLKEAKPDRLLIEPTGLGHPKQIIAALSKPEYHSVLDLRATLTLVDARKIADARYRDHPTFQQQLEVADLLIAHKADLYREPELDQLQHYLDKLGLATVPLESVIQGALDPSLLDLPQFNIERSSPHHHGAESFHTHGWRFAPSIQFDAAAIEALFSEWDGIRLKAVVQTTTGAFAYNKTDGTLTTTPLQIIQESRVELIDTDTLWDKFGKQLSSCMVKPNRIRTE